MAADNGAILFVNGTKVGDVSDMKSVHELNIVQNLHAGKNVLALAVKMAYFLPPSSTWAAGPALIETRTT